MTRRQFISTAAVAAAAPSMSEAPLFFPVHLVRDVLTEHAPEKLSYFSSSIWPEAVRDFSRCGIELQSSEGTGEVRRSPGGKPLFNGLELGVINFVLTGYVPLQWDHGRGLAGLSTRYERFHVCIVALSYAHGHQVPFLSVNTCVHELLHVLLQDIFVSRPEGWWPSAKREFRIDWYATRLWLFHDGGAIRRAAQPYLERLRSSVDMGT